MKHFLKLAALTLTVLVATPALSQDTAKPAQAFPQGTTPELKVGQIYVVKKEGDWQVRCVKVAEGPEPCHAYQLIHDDQGNAVAEINVVHLPGGGAVVAGANVITPLGTLLQNQMVFAINGSEPKSYPYQWCEVAGCIAQMSLTGLDLEALKSGKAATITISSIGGDAAVVLPVSLNGFSATFSAVLVKK